MHHIELQIKQHEKSRMFDFRMEGHSFDDEEFEDMDITDENKRTIVGLVQYRNH